QQIDIVCTPNHRFHIKHRKTGAWRTYTAAEYQSDQLQPQAGHFVGGTLRYTQDQHIAIAAFQADGHIMKLGRGGIEWSFAKRRKIDRLLGALNRLGLPVKLANKYGNPDGRITLRDVPEWLKDKKQFGDWILQLDKESFDFLAEEVWFWDAYYAGRTMFTNNCRSDADWVQIMTVLSGRRAKMRKTQTSAGNDHWWVDAVDRDCSMTTNFTRSRVPYRGYVYCVTMPKDTIIVRYNGRVLITGNSQNFPKRKNADIREQIRAQEGWWLLSV